jgi:hypothetical protein
VGRLITVFAIDEVVASSTSGQFILRQKLAPPQRMSCAPLF